MIGLDKGGGGILGLDCVRWTRGGVGEGMDGRPVALHGQKGEGSKGVER